MKQMLIGGIFAALLAVILFVTGVQISWVVGAVIIVGAIVILRAWNHSLEQNAKEKSDNDG